MSRKPGDRRRLALAELDDRVIRCRRCPRLVEWREGVAEKKRAAFADQEYWGRPVPGFGDPDAWLLVLGLAPAAHGANRTGRMFTGDRSGDWLFRALHRAGIASQPESTSRHDGLRLDGAYVTATVRCCPPDNRPTPSERGNCRGYLERELDLLEDVRVVVALGGYAYRHILRLLRDRELAVPSPMPAFEHGLELEIASGDGERERWTWRSNRLALIASYHPSQQNTFTGRLTEEMFDAIWSRAVEVGET